MKEPENRRQSRSRQGGATKFKKGQSGNPGGRPKLRADFVEACRKHSPEALEVLVKEFRDGGDHRIKAAVHVLEWAWGKPAAAPEDRDAMTEAARPMAALTPAHLLKIIDSIEEDDDQGEG